MILKYTVQSGDSLSKIADKIYGDFTQWPVLKKYNPFITSENTIYPGQILEYPSPGSTGDSPKTSGVVVPEAIAMETGLKKKLIMVMAGAGLAGIVGALFFGRK